MSSPTGINVNRRPMEPLQEQQSPAGEETRKIKKRRSHTRTIKACDLCRKQKTRCLKSSNTIGCLRCLSLGVNCSFEDDFKNNPADTFLGVARSNSAQSATVPSPNAVQNTVNTTSFTFPSPSPASAPTPVTSNTPAVSTAEKQPKDLTSRLLDITNNLKDVVTTLQTNPASLATATSTFPLPIPNAYDNSLNLEKLEINMSANTTKQIAQSPIQQLVESSSGSSVPALSLINQLGSTARTTIKDDGYLKELDHQTDLISHKVLTEEQALKLLTIFVERYGRWVSFPDNFNSIQLLTRIRTNCPLLLTVACCISLKYGDPSLKRMCYLEVLQILKKDLATCLLVMPKSLEFLQCLIILSLYSSTLSSDYLDLKLDSLLISNTGINLFLTLNQLGFSQFLYDRNQVDLEFNELTIYRLWNYLIMIQFVYCILTGKKSIYSLNLLKPKKFPKLSISTNFDSRIISEIEMWIICYSKMNLNFDLQGIKIEMKDWLNKWNHLFNKRASQFVEIDYHYTELIILSLDNVQLDPTAPNSAEPVDLQMFKIVYFHCFKILNLINSIKDDSYFAFLSDSIHLIVVHSSMVGLKLLGLNNYLKIKDENQLRECFKLIFKLINRYKRLSTHDTDAFLNYAELLEQNLLARFPNVNPLDFINEIDDDQDDGDDNEYLSADDDEDQNNDYRSDVFDQISMGIGLEG